MATMRKHPSMRWAVPAFAVAAVGATVIAPSALADPSLPPKTAEQLLVDLQNQPSAFSGTIQSRTDLGLPPLTADAGNDFTALASGTHTLRVWQNGPDKSRVALIGDAAESAVIRNGDEVWRWSSETSTATHTTLTGEKPPQPTPTEVPKTPQEAAERVLAELEPTTEVTTSGTSDVAGRPAYELVLDPRSDATLIERVTIAVDAETNAPLRVEVWPTGGDRGAAIQVSYTDIDYAVPADSMFTFTPPPGATVEEADQTRPDGAGTESDRPEPVTTGEGWERVTVVTMPEKPTTEPTPSAPPPEGAPDLQAYLDSLPTAQGSWGQGKVLYGSLFTVLITDDGKVAFGAVGLDRVVAAIR